MGTLKGIREYWGLLTTPGRWLLILQVVLLGCSLMLVHHDGGNPFAGTDQPALVEGANLLRFQLFWCAWSEQLYSVRLFLREGQTLKTRFGARLILHLYGGFLFMAVLSVLAALNPLLGIGAMFLLFTSAEALDKSVSKMPKIRALAKGLRRSIQLISAEAIPFLMRLLLPGLVLYAGGMVVVWVKQQREVWDPTLSLGISLTLLLVWLLFFVLAQIRLQYRAIKMEDGIFAASAEEASGGLPGPLPTGDRAVEPLRQLIDRFEGWCNWSAALGACCA